MTASTDPTATGPHGPDKAVPAATNPGAPSPAAHAAGRSRRLKSLTILAVVVWSALVFLAWSQPWFTLNTQGRAGDTISVEVQGAIAAPALSALALAGLALAAALAIAGTIVRAVLGVLELVLGLSIAASAVGAVANPVQAGQSAITKATGVAGSSSLQSIASLAGSNIWPFVAIVVGVLMALTGILLIVTLRRWPVSGRRYQPVRFAAEDGREAGSPIELIGAAGHPEAVDDVTPDDITGDITGSEHTTPAAEATTPDDETENTAAVDSWDRLSRGQDPTAT